MSTINSDPLFVGLTRPTMIFGVSIQFALLNILVSCVIFVMLSSFKIIPIAFLIHGIGYILCFKEPKFLELYMNKFQRCSLCKNKAYYKANSYKV
jgi:type IV secretion system protein VirB3